MTALRDAKAHSIDVEFGLPERNVDQQGPVAGALGHPQKGDCSLASERAFHDEASSLCDERPAHHDRPPGCRDRRAGWFRCVDSPGDCVRVDDRHSSRDLGGDCALPRTVRAGDQNQCRHLRGVWRQLAQHDDVRLPGARLIETNFEAVSFRPFLDVPTCLIPVHDRMSRPKCCGAGVRACLHDSREELVIENSEFCHLTHYLVFPARVVTDTSPKTAKATANLIVGFGQSWYLA